MSDILTRIRLPDGKPFVGLLDWGRKDGNEMICLVRAYADRLRAEVERIDAATDADFQIDVVRGSIVQRFIAEVQKSKIQE